MIILNEFGKAKWRNKYNMQILAERPYEWCDRILIIDEANGRRKVIDDVKFSTFSFQDWIPVEN